MAVPEPEHPRLPARDRCQESACRCKRRSVHWKPQESKEPLTHRYLVRAEGFCSIKVRVKGISGAGVDRSVEQSKTFQLKKRHLKTRLYPKNVRLTQPFLDHRISVPWRRKRWLSRSIVYFADNNKKKRDINCLRS